MSQLTPVTFHGDTLYIINHEGEPFTPIKPIVENMGLDWSSQHAKIKANSERWATMAIIATVQDGKQRETLCMPVRKLPAFMASINPKKVREELRERIRLYQDECDNALWDYWSKGQATRGGKKALPKAEQQALPPADPFDVLLDNIEIVRLRTKEDVSKLYHEAVRLADKRLLGMNIWCELWAPLYDWIEKAIVASVSTKDPHGYAAGTPIGLLKAVSQRLERIERQEMRRP